MKTALQEAFTELEKLHPSLFDIYTEKGREFVNNFHKFLELEKQQIIEAHGNKQRTKSNPNSIVTYGYTFTGEMYYQETFEK
jgi:hypothetical protein